MHACTDTHFQASETEQSPLVGFLSQLKGGLSLFGLDSQVLVPTIV